MKKVFAILLISAVISACGGSKSGSGGADSAKATDEAAKAHSSEADTSANKTGASSTTTAELAPGAKLMAGSDCTTCHKEDVKIVGPALKDIAAKYPPTDANIAMLTDKVIKGGSGHWGDIPMAAHPQLKKEDVTTMVKYVLSLKK